MKSAVLIFIFLTPLLCWSQENIISSIIGAAKAGGEEFPLYENMFQREDNGEYIDANYFVNPDEVNVFTSDYNLDNLNLSSWSVEILLADSLVTLDLLKVPDSFFDYEVVTDGGERYSGHESTGKHFRGIINGDNNSLVAISFFEDQIMGIIGNDNGNYNIGNIKNFSNKIIVFNENNLMEQFDFQCGVEEPDGNFIPSLQEDSESSQKCLSLYFETEYEFFEIFGSVNAVENHVTALFNQVSLIYLNESISTKISEIMVWTVEDPYIGINSSLPLLYAFRDKINVSSFNGDLAQLLVRRSVGGRAHLNRLCNSNKGLRTSVAQNLSFGSEYPIGSFDVEVITHEFGHLIGSPHTHACVWNGNNTAIDGCGPIEGTCPDPGIPPINERSIMSYCSIYNFNYGFAPQPGDLIRNRVNNATCLENCDDGCMPQILINYPIVSTITHQAHYLIYATSEIADDITVSYKAGQVRLRPGFHVKGTESGNFIAMVDPCYEETNFNFDKNFALWKLISFL